MFDLNRALRPAWVRKSTRLRSDRSRRSALGLEPLEGRTLLAVTTLVHPIPDVTGFRIQNIAPGPDNSIWFTEVRDSITAHNPQPPAGFIGRMSSTGQVSIFPLPTNMSVSAITVGSDGNAYFAEQFQSVDPNPVGTIEGTPTGIGSTPGVGGPIVTLTNQIERITPQGSFTTLVAASSLPQQLSTTYLSLTNTPDGNILATGGGEVVKIAPSGDLTIRASSTDLTDVFVFPVIGSDGNVWVANNKSSGAEVDRINADGTIARFPLDSSLGFAANLVNGPDGNIWFLSNDHGAEISKITPSGIITTYATPSNFAIDGLAASTSNSSIWFVGQAYPQPGDPNPLQLGRISSDGVISIDPPLSSTIFDSGPITFTPDGSLKFVESVLETAGELASNEAIGEVDFSTLAITGVSRAYSFRSGRVGSEAIVQFNSAPDATSATDLANYSIEASRVTRRGTVDLGSIAIRSVQYNAANGTVKLQLARPLNPYLHYTINVKGQGVTSVSGIEGQRLAGAGQPGTTYTGVVSRLMARLQAARLGRG